MTKFDRDAVSMFLENESERLKTWAVYYARDKDVKKAANKAAKAFAEAAEEIRKNGGAQ